LRYIVIDPGHGGKDNGAQNNAYAVKEKPSRSILPDAWPAI
jgi:hypothetical protein